MTLSPELFIFKTDAGYYGSLPDEDNTRFDVSKENAIPLCTDCLLAWEKLFSDFDLTFSHEFYDAADRCPHCQKTLVDYNVIAAMRAKAFIDVGRKRKRRWP